MRKREKSVLWGQSTLSVLRTLFPLLRTLFPLLRTLFPLLRTLFPLLRTLFPLLHTLFPLLRTLFPLLRTLTSLLRTLTSLLHTRSSPWQRSDGLAGQSLRSHSLWVGTGIGNALGDFALRRGQGPPGPGRESELFISKSKPNITKSESFITRFSLL